jgi:hypothetical protein
MYFAALLLMASPLWSAVGVQVAHSQEQTGAFSYDSLRGKARDLAAAEYHADTPRIA